MTGEVEPTFEHPCITRQLKLSANLDGQEREKFLDQLLDYSFGGSYECRQTGCVVLCSPNGIEMSASVECVVKSTEREEEFESKQLAQDRAEALENALAGKD